MPDLLERLSSALGDRYAIEREVGRGGMAVVFLAEDLKHHRQVALKVLHPELTATLGAERFLHEIEIIAGLQHPHILPLYDSGEAEGLLYYVMPYARGESLRQRLDREKQLAVDESVRIAVEVADGLDYAHRQGVVHRDIKPGNILLAEGHATIADFGIARAIEVARAERVTSTGLGVGTPLYASPEQATAQETLDGRTDIYSLGCVLYEMLAGQPPLTGATPQMIQARRVSETPSPLHDLRDTVPPALDHVIARALARIPADRYATASQFGQSLQAAVFAATPAAMADLAATPASLATTPMSRNAEPKRKVPQWWPVVVAVLGIGLIAMLWPPSRWLGEGPLQITTSNIKRVTNDPGLEFQPAISPDGGEVAYVIGPPRGARIVLRGTVDVGGGGETRPSEDAGGYRHWLPAWTPGGESLRFLVCGLESGCVWKEAGKLGGSARIVSVSSLSARSAWSPDGTRVVLASGDSLFVASVDGGGPQLIGVHTAYPRGQHSLAWSPDGQRIAYVNGNDSWQFGANVASSSIWILNANGGEPVRVTDDLHMDVSPQWLPDSRHLLFVSDRDGPRGIHVVEVGYEGPRGPPRSVLSSSDPHSISISADGRRLAYAKFTARQNIWSIPISEGGVVSISDAVPVTVDNQIIESHSLSEDGEWLAFDSDIRGGFDIYKMPLTGGNPQLVADLTGDAYNPAWSPNGTEISFDSETLEGLGEVYVVSADGGTPEQVTDFPGWENLQDWSPDGLAIAFGSQGPEGVGWQKVWIVSRASLSQPWGDPIQLTDFPCSWPEWTPDGRSVLCAPGGGQGYVMVSRDGAVLSRYDLSAAGLRRRSPPTLSIDGTRIYFTAEDRDGSYGIWWIPAYGGDPTKAVAIDDPLKSMFLLNKITMGPESLYLTIGEYEGDIWVMDLEW